MEVVVEEEDEGRRNSRRGQGREWTFIWEARNERRKEG